MGYHTIRLTALVIGIDKQAELTRTVNWPLIPAAGLWVRNPFGVAPDATAPLLDSDAEDLAALAIEEVGTNADGTELFAAFRPLFVQADATLDALVAAAQAAGWEARAPAE